MPSTQIRMLPVVKPIKGSDFLRCWMPVFYPQFQPGERGYRARACQLLANATGRHWSTFDRYVATDFEEMPLDICHTLSVIDYTYRLIDRIDEMGEGMKARFEFIYPEELNRMCQPKRTKSK